MTGDIHTTEISVPSMPSYFHIINPIQLLLFFFQLNSIIGIKIHIREEIIDGKVYFPFSTSAHLNVTVRKKKRTSKKRHTNLGRNV